MPEQRRALVVDDEKLVCESCSSILAERGYDVATSMSARDGLRRVGKERFDLLLADLRMPDIDGIELIEQVRAKAPEIAVIVITGYPSVDTAVRATQLGALEYIAKPFTPDELMSGIASALAKYERIRRTREGPGRPRLVTAQLVETAIASTGARAPRRAEPASGAAERTGVITVDLNACMNCLTCVVECGLAHLPPAEGDAPARLDFKKLGSAMNGARVQVESVGTHCVPMRCNQCEDPPCAKVCPTGALSKSGPDRPVVIDHERCIGCKSCVLACPFGSIYVNGETNMVIKCDLCEGVVGPDEEPVCVRTCPAGALRLVPVSEAADETRRRAARDVLEASLGETKQTKEARGR